MPEAHTLRMHACRKYHAWILEPSGYIRYGVKYTSLINPYLKYSCLRSFEEIQINP